MRESIRCVGASLLCVLTLAVARPAAAQDTPRLELSGGYNWLTAKASDDDEWTKFPKGWYVDVAGNVAEMVGIVGQVTGNYKTFGDEDVDLNIHTFMGGVRASSAGRIRGFGQFLVGGTRLNASAEGFEDFSETDWAIQLGGGVNVLGSRHIGVRAGADYLRVFARDDGFTLAGEDIDGLRFNVGIVLGFGSR